MPTLVQETHGVGQPDLFAVAAGQHAVRIALERRVLDQPGLAAGLLEGVVHARHQFRAEQRVVLAVHPQARDLVLRAVFGKGRHQRRTPAAAVAVVAQAAGKVDQGAHARQFAGAQRHRRQAAVGLAGNDDAVGVDPLLVAGKFQGVADVLGLDVAVGGHVAAAVAVAAGGVGEALAHRHHHRVAAFHEGVGHVVEAVARLQVRAARILAVVDDDEREGARTVRLEHGRLQARRMVAASRDQHDVLVDPVVELQLLLDRQAGQHGKADDQRGGKFANRCTCSKHGRLWGGGTLRLCPLGTICLGE
jgi:hypothetical protein